ncbi:MAG: Mov34/MPN/PAD-1 family protein [Anaerolineae bacterium]|jgi:proteasome lid subunit RPN8/RPN11
MNETCYILIGMRRGRIWYGRLRQRSEGEPHTVAFDWAWVLDREARYGDVAGFHHTHPPGLPAPSARDQRTMRAWVSCLGKPLLCVVESGDVVAAYVFGSDEDDGQAVAEVQRFPRRALVAVEKE